MINLNSSRTQNRPPNFLFVVLVLQKNQTIGFTSFEITSIYMKNKVEFFKKVYFFIKNANFVHIVYFKKVIFGRFDIENGGIYMI